MTDNTHLAAALAPLIERVRTDITAVKKANGEQAWTDQPLTPDRLARHLNGGPARGVCPIGPGENVTMVGLLDFDSHGGEVGWVEMSAVVRRVVETMEFADGAAPILFRSSGGRGVHLYVLWDEPQDARSVRVWLRGALAACGLRSGTKGVAAGAVEVYPKQDSVAEDGNGSQFILPLAGRSVALEWCDLAGCYVESEVIAWPFSPPVPVAPPEEPRVRREVADDGAVWRSALDALTNKGSHELEYDDWRNVVFAIHHETDGSDDGLELALDWSARSGKHNETFLLERVWPYVRSDRGGAVITGRTIMSLAARLHGWSEPLSDDAFGVVEDDDEPASDVDWRGAGDAGSGGVDRGLVGVRTLAGEEGSEAPSSGAGSTVQAGAHGLRGREVGSGASVQEGAAGSTGDGDAGAEAGSGAGRPDAVGQPAGRSGRGAIPDAEHLTTDQANAGRLVRLSGRRLLVAEGRWHAWDGSRWAADESDVYRAACGLSRVVREEAIEWDRRVALLKSQMVERIAAVQSGNVSGVAGRAAVDVLVSGDGGQRAVAGARAVVGELDLSVLDEMKQGAELAESLHKWSAKSEMKVTIEAAVGLARKMLTVDTMLMDANPWLLNTPGGVVDLQTGGLRKARAADLLTKITAVPYVPGADQSVWLKFVREVCGEDLELAAFVQRWFGYCATGSVREQVFVVHWGQGSNGKSTLLDTVARVLGDYAGVAAPGLLASSERGSERHPTEIAGLRGKRMVTAHESDDGAVLREGFVKQVTGDDKMSGRFMREDFFDFTPTHKVQLLTNHKPGIRGNDPAIWRRVLLVPYGQSWGTAEQVEKGERMHVADLELAERLRGDGRALAGVMAWIVDGAVAWARGGLQAPAVVRAAVAGYRTEQDRLGQFVRECCEIAPAGVLARLVGMDRAGEPWWQDAEIVAWSEPLISGGLHGLYGIYAAWCKEAGVHALARTRFSDALGRVNAGFRVRDAWSGSGEGRRHVMRVFGLKVLQE